MSDKMTFAMGDEKYTFDLDDTTGLEDRAFRQAVGMPVHKAVYLLSIGDMALEAVAGLIWLVRRRDEDGLSYETVLGDLSYADLTTQEEEEEAPLDTSSETPGPDSVTTSA